MNMVSQEFPDDESDDSIDDEISDDLEDEEVDDDSPRRDGQRVAQLQAQLESANTQVTDLNKRLGDNIRINGERLKQAQDDVDVWLEKVQVWASSEIDIARDAAYKEGAKSVEDRLLPLLGTEEKTEYMFEATRTPHSPSPRPVQKLETRKAIAIDDNVEDTSRFVRQFTSLGVPLDQLDQTSAQTVVDSGSKYLATRTDTVIEKVNSLENKLETREREASGATKVSSGSGETRPVKSTLQRQLEQVEKDIQVTKQRHQIDRYTALSKQKREIEAQLRSRR